MSEQDQAENPAERELRLLANEQRLHEAECYKAEAEWLAHNGRILFIRERRNKILMALNEEQAGPGPAEHLTDEELHAAVKKASRKAEPSPTPAPSPARGVNRFKKPQRAPDEGEPEEEA